MEKHRQPWQILCRYLNSSRWVCVSPLQQLMSTRRRVIPAGTLAPDWQASSASASTSSGACAPAGKESGFATPDTKRLWSWGHDRLRTELLAEACWLPAGNVSRVAAWCDRRDFVVVRSADLLLTRGISPMGRELRSLVIRY
jgi:hypothetical protein